mmetsp:Transcript_26245/g.48956  ORF Transcript_26245/g.48956 Transcript_26245/m.48956 type:complete len:94 (-) Transcript_26245:1401-1682(-)
MSTAQETVGIELESKGRGKKFEHLLSITQIQKRGFDLVARWETQCAVGYTAVKTFGTKGRARNVEHLVKSIEDPISDRHHPAVIAKVMCIQIE